ncbi:MAG: Mth938-like domain-containing protein [Candidatus Thermoplasmatota archaeon]
MVSNFIEDYSFGKIVIDGERYTDDVILLGEKIIDGWWRKKGHRVVKGDLKKVLEYSPDILIIGTGNSGRMRVPSELPNKLKFEVESYSTQKACDRYNKLVEGDKKIAGGFHLTC